MNKNDSIVKTEKKGKNTIIIVLLGLIILGLVGYICYDKGIIFSSNDKSNDTQASKSETKDNNKTVENKKMFETLFSVTAAKDFYLTNDSASIKILDYSNFEDGFLNGISILDLENNNLYYVENKWQIVDGNAKNHKYRINKIISNEYNEQKEMIYESIGSVSDLYVKDGILYFKEQISTLNGNIFDETTNLKSYDLKSKSEKILKTLKTTDNSGSFIRGMYVSKKDRKLYYVTSDNKLYEMSLDGSNEKKITDDCNNIYTYGGSLVYNTSNSENYLLYNSDFKKVNSSNVWLYKDGYIYSNEKGITYYDGNEEKNIYTDTKEYYIKYVDGNNNTMLIVDSDGYGEGSNYKKIDLTNYSVNNADFPIGTFIRTIEYK